MTTTSTADEDKPKPVFLKDLPWESYGSYKNADVPGFDASIWHWIDGFEGADGTYDIRVYHGADFTDHDGLDALEAQALLNHYLAR